VVTASDGENGPLEMVPLLVPSPPHSQHESTDPKQVKTRGRILQSILYNQPLPIRVNKNHDFYFLNKKPDLFDLNQISWI